MMNENLKQLGLQGDSQKVVETEIVKISTQLKSAQPKSSVIKQSLQTVRNVLEGVTGSLLASGLLYQLSQISM